jgi:hypothetical protein
MCRADREGISCSAIGNIASETADAMYVSARPVRIYGVYGDLRLLGCVVVGSDGNDLVMFAYKLLGS